MPNHAPSFCLPPAHHLVRPLQPLPHLLCKRRSRRTLATPCPTCCAPPDDSASSHAPRECDNGPDLQFPLPLEPRPDVPPGGPPFIPQTIEYAIVQAQAATRRALEAGVTYVRVELPMGRSRAHWYVLSPPAAWYEEASVLAFHFAEMFKGLHISLVLGTGPGVTHPVPWMADVRRLEDDPEPLPIDGAPRVVIFAGVRPAQRELLLERVAASATAQAVVMLNSMLETPLTQKMAPFRFAYACRAFHKHAVLRETHDGAWSIFVEIAVFEYEWVGDRGGMSDSASNSGGDEGEWMPTQGSIERFAVSRGAFRKKENAYFQTEFAGCEAGFWPFMTICCREVLPLDGRKLDEEERAKQQKNKSKTFGFF